MTAGIAQNRHVRLGAMRQLKTIFLVLTLAGAVGLSVLSIAREYMSHSPQFTVRTEGGLFRFQWAAIIWTGGNADVDLVLSSNQMVSVLVFGQDALFSVSSRTQQAAAGQYWSCEGLGVRFSRNSPIRREDWPISVRRRSQREVAPTVQCNQVPIFDDSVRVDGTCVVVTSLRLPLLYLVAVSWAYPLLVLIRGPVLRYWRRSSGRCVKCGYDLTGNESGRCSECGEVIAERRSRIAPYQWTTIQRKSVWGAAWGLFAGVAGLGLCAMLGSDAIRWMTYPGVVILATFSEWLPNWLVDRYGLGITVVLGIILCVFSGGLLGFLIGQRRAR